MTDADYVALVYAAVLRRPPAPHESAYWESMLGQGHARDVVVAALAEQQRQASLHEPRLFVPPGHFYSPIVDPERIRAAFRSRPPPDALPHVRLDRAAHLALWQEFLPFFAEMPFSEGPQPGLRYRFDNPAFGFGDGSVLYAMLRRFRPRRLVEVGSGWSSACAVDTARRFLPGAVDFTFIEPNPELLLELLGDLASEYRVHAAQVQDVDPGIFDALEDGDFLFVDSTHVLKTGSDVAHLLFEVLPRLAPGVFVHFHDVFWPFEYPAQWVLDDNRSWNEIYALRAFLTCNDAFRVVFFNDYFMHHFRDRVAQDYPTMLRNTGGSLWIQKAR